MASVARKKANILVFITLQNTPAGLKLNAEISMNFKRDATRVRVVILLDTSPG